MTADRALPNLDHAECETSFLESAASEVLQRAPGQSIDQPAPEGEQGPDSASRKPDGVTIERLAALPLLEYDRVRNMPIDALSADLQHGPRDEPRHPDLRKVVDGHQCWELDALSPVILRQRVDEHILDLLDVDAWNHAMDIEAAERESMSNMLSKWPGISIPATKYSSEAP